MRWEVKGSLTSAPSLSRDVSPCCRVCDTPSFFSSLSPFLSLGWLGSRISSVRAFYASITCQLVSLWVICNKSQLYQLNQIRLYKLNRKSKYQQTRADTWGSHQGPRLLLVFCSSVLTVGSHPKGCRMHTPHTEMCLHPKLEENGREDGKGHSPAETIPSYQINKNFPRGPSL